MSAETWEQFEAKWAQVVAESWQNEEVRQKVLSDPAAVLRERGLDISDRYDIKIAPGATRTLVELPLPPRPRGLSERALAATSGDDITVCSSCCCSC